MARAFPPEVAEAKAYLRGGEVAPADALALAKTLLGKDEVSYARRVLIRASRDQRTEPDTMLVVRQQWALATSKDLDLPSTRHRDALNILHRGDDLRTTQAQETLGIAAES